MKGTVRKRESGRWQYLFTINLDGQKKQITGGGFRTKSEAQAALTSRLTDYQRGVRPTMVRSVPTLSTFLVEEWLPSLSLKPSTVAGYQWLAERYLLPRLGAKKLSDVTASMLVNHYRYLRREGGRNGRPLSESTVHAAAVILTSAMTHAVEMGLINTSPAHAIPRRNRPQARRPGVSTSSVWTEAEARRFVKATRADRLGIAWHLLLATGVRRGELAGLRWEDVDLEKKKIQITRNRVVVGWTIVDGDPKSGKGRSITLDESTVRALRRHRVRTAADRLAAGTAWADSGLVVVDEVGHGVHPGSLTPAFNAAVKRVGVRRIRLHDTRHTHATLLLAAGVPAKVVQERLGHTVIGTTLDSYGHVTSEMEGRCADEIGRILSS